VCRGRGLRDNISHKTSLYHVPGLHDTIALKRLFARVPGLRDNISHKTSLYRVPGLHDTIALKRLFAVCQIYVAIFPLKRLCIVCHAFVTQIITLPLNFTISEPAVLLVVLWRKTCLILFIFSHCYFLQRSP